MKRCGTSSTIKLQRKVVEKNRRLHMKSQCLKLASLVPSHHRSKVELSQHEQVDLAVDYIEQMKVTIDELKRKRDRLMIGTVGSSKGEREGMVKGLPLSVVEVRDLGSSLEVIVVTESNRKFMTCDVITALVEGGADVVSASFSFVNDTVILIIHCQTASSKLGFESESVCQKLKGLVLFYL